jgi:hypothetical protein
LFGPGSDYKALFECRSCKLLCLCRISNFPINLGCDKCNSSGVKGEITFERSIASDARMMLKFSPNNFENPLNVALYSNRIFLWICGEGHVYPSRTDIVYKGAKCKQCVIVSKLISLSQEPTIQEVEIKFQLKWGDKYRYNWCTYHGFCCMMEIICKIHGSFWKTPHDHIFNDVECKTCKFGHETYSFGPVLLSKENLLKRCQEVWGEIYIIDLDSYLCANFVFTIICRKHGPFQKRLANFLAEYGCPICMKEVNDSLGIKQIKRILNCIGQPYTFEVTFNDLYGDGQIKPKKLAFDIYCEIINEPLLKEILLNEFDGGHHFKECLFNDGILFDQRKRYDLMRDLYAIKNGYNFIRIPYWAKPKDMIFIISLAIREIKKGKKVYISYPHHSQHVKPGKEYLVWNWIIPEKVKVKLQEDIYNIKLIE